MPKAAVQSEIRCFVAMAFGRPDTDALYDETIAPLLRELGVVPVRVDRIEHNDNIDDRIVSEIRAADFAIADLTYARPSVYFEAGYAERAIPTVYTIRGDHFVPQADDEFGVFRLHFDLAMRNVVDWATPVDAGFRARLRSRLEFVTAPLRARRQDDEGKAKAVTAFRAKSVTTRRNAVEKALRKALAARKYMTADGSRSAAAFKTPWGIATEYFKCSDGIYHYVKLGFYIDSERYWAPHANNYNLNVGKALGAIETIREHLFTFAFRAVPPETLAGDTTDYDILDEGSEFLARKAVEIPKLPKGFDGEVVITRDDVPTSLVERFQTGKRWSRGFNTDTPPPGTVWKKRYAGSMFVYDGFSWRRVKKETYIHLVNDIETVEDARSRFDAALDRSEG